MGDLGEQKTLGRACTDIERTQNKARAESIREIENALQQLVPVQNGKTVWKRIAQLADPGTFLPLQSLYNPENNLEGTVGVITGLAKVEGKCVCVIASDPDIRRGAWLPGQPQKILQMQRLAELMHTPIVWLLECSGLDLEQQDRVYSGHQSGGRIFFNNARLASKSIPIVAGIFGTNVAGGGYHAISATKRFAHKDANMAIGGAAILSGMQPSKSGFNEEDSDTLLAEIERVRKVPPPGSVAVHGEEGTRFFDGIYDTEAEVISAIRRYTATLDTGNFLSTRGTVQEPCYDVEDLYYFIPHNQRMTYDIENILARLVDESVANEYRSGFGPEVYCWFASIDGCPVGIIGNRQGFLPHKYPEYADYQGAGGKLYRQGLIKMAAFVSECSKEHTPIIWLQDTSGIDVGDQAERAGLLGLGQQLVYQVENAHVPMATVILRKGHAASHYVMCGPMASTNACTLGTALTEIMVMHAETGAIARYGRELKKAGTREQRLLVIEKMNAFVSRYQKTSQPHDNARRGVVDEVAPLSHLRCYLSWFVNAAYTPVKVPKDGESLWTLGTACGG